MESKERERWDGYFRAAVLLRFLRKLAGLDGLGEREEPILEALLAIAEDA